MCVLCRCPVRRNAHLRKTAREQVFRPLRASRAGACSARRSMTQSADAHPSARSAPAGGLSAWPLQLLRVSGPQAEMGQAKVGGCPWSSGHPPSCCHACEPHACRWYNPSIVEHNGRLLSGVKLTTFKFKKKKNWWINTVFMCRSMDDERTMRYATATAVPPACKARKAARPACKARKAGRRVRVVQGLRSLWHWH